MKPKSDESSTILYHTSEPPLHQPKLVVPSLSLLPLWQQAAHQSGLRMWH